MLLQSKIDEVLEGVHLSDLLHDEVVVRTRVGFRPPAEENVRRLPVLHG